MKIILRESYENLGHPGDIVEVKGGFARNFLVPQGIAYPANKFYLNRFEQERDVLLKRDAQARAEAEKVAGDAMDINVEFIVKIGVRGQMHGAITNADIAEKMAEKGITVDRRKIALPEPLKTTGTHRIRVKLHADVGFDVVVTITPEAPPAEDMEEMEGELAEAVEEAVEGGEDGPVEIVEMVEMVPAEPTTESEAGESEPVKTDDE